VTTVNRRATKTLPAALWVPQLRRHHHTARRNARSAALLVGATPSVVTNVHSAASTLRMLARKRQDSERTQALARISPSFPSVDRCYAACNTAHTSPHRSWNKRR